ncbi:hypothetical protein FNV43_RR13147 [Rhamnella rubrinervis]|uniref:Protein DETOXIFICATION n=1 Tax=Rhamnella rubrinervis TaxID=2594499 RepID=A0A8K0MEQ9_9ROSA|nr:hypothetical protein FNV43_RR13147 [Rhamnella rubrinervis]
MAMEEALLAESCDLGKKWNSSALMKELKRLISMAAPMVVVSASQYLLQVVAVMMAGHIDELSLGVAIANSFTNVTGFSVLLGMASALETLCGQAYGAGQYEKFGMKYWSSIVHMLILLVECHIAWLVHQVFFRLAKTAWRFDGSVLQHKGIPLLCRPFCSYGLHLSLERIRSWEFRGGSDGCFCCSGACDNRGSHYEHNFLLLSLYSILGYAFSNIKQVVDYFERLVPLLSLSFIMDSLLAVLCGIARGCGWQDLGAYTNLASYYLVGIPIAIALGFLLNLRAIGLWIGILAGSIVQVVLLSLITCSTNWQKQVLRLKYAFQFYTVSYSHGRGTSGGEELRREADDVKEEFINRGVQNLISMAAPMVVVSVSQYLFQVVSVMMAGHIDELSLSGVALASSFTNVTGFSFLVGLAGALETLCGQAYGAGQYQKCGMFTNCAIISLILVCFPVSLLWIFVEKLLILIGQDPLISHEAGKYSILLIPALFANAILQSLIRYFQSQGLIFPMLVSSCATLCLHIPVCWVLVYKFELGSTGAAMSICLSFWLNVLFLGLYMMYSSNCEKTRVAFSIQVSGVREFICFAVPSAAMVCIEWWSFELLILLSGLLPNPKLETSVLSICLTTTSLHYFIPYGVSAAASTRVSNELGAGNSQAAQKVVYSVMMLAVTEAIVLSTTLFCCRSVLGYAYSNAREVVDYIERLTPCFLCPSSWTA